MEYIVSGANRQTGRDVRFTIEAATEGEARDQAADMGIVVARVQVKAAPPAVVESAPPVQYAAPQQHVAAAQPQVHIATTPKRSNSLGIVSMILGIIAFLLCWIPFISVISLPLSGLGLLLAVIGFVVALTRSGYGVGWPIGGGALNGIALLVALVTGIGAFGAVKSAGDELIARNEGRRQARASAPTYDPGVWISDAPLHVRVDRVIVGRAAMDTWDDSIGRAANVRTIIYITVLNPDDAVKRDYRTLRGDTFDFADRTARLSDDAGNSYTVVRSDNYSGAVHLRESVYPGQALRDVLVFEQPVQGVDSLTLELPLGPLDGAGWAKVRIPAESIEHVDEPDPPADVDVDG